MVHIAYRNIEQKYHQYYIQYIRTLDRLDVLDRVVGRESRATGTGRDQMLRESVPSSLRTEK